MMWWRMCIFLTCASTMAAAESEITSSRLRQNIPSYLNHKTMDAVISAIEARFYKDKIPTARIVENLRKDPIFLEKALGDREDGDPTCLNQILKGTLDYFLGRQYARQVIDSQGTEESGLLKGNYLWLGNYFECNAATDGKNFKGGMCVSIFGDNPNSTDGLYIGLCWPDICTSTDINALLQAVVGNQTFVTTFCPRKNQEFDAVDIFAIIIFSLLAALVVAGTIFEIVVTWNGENRTLNVSSRLLVSFSVIKNTRTLLNTTRKEGNISVLDGMRFFSMGWVILGHTIYLSASATDNLIDVGNFYITHGSSLAVVNGTFSVDSFFFLSGLLVAYLGLREMNKRNGKMNVPLMYLHRYLRLTPTLALVMLFTVSLFMKIGDGPLFQLRSEPMVPPCQKYWWTNLLYINNLYPANMEDDCIGWVWYLANDMQFYLLSPVFLFLFYRHAKGGIITIGFVILASAAITGALSTHFKLWTDVIFYGFLGGIIQLFSAEDVSVIQEFGASRAPLNESTTTAPTEETMSDPYFNDIYTKPWCRIGVYLIGMTTGYILFITKKNIKMNKIFVIVMWLVVAAIELSIIYGYWATIEDFELPSQNVMSFYNAVSRPVWGFGLMWITIACACGYGGFVNNFLSWKVFMPLSRLTFCAYLIHPLVMQYVYTSREIEMHWRVNIYIYYYLANMVLSYCAGYLLSMLIEAPVGELQKIVFPSRKPQAQKRQDEPDILTQVNGDAVTPTENCHGPVANGKTGIQNHIELEEHGISDKGEYL